MPQHSPRQNLLASRSALPFLAHGIRGLVVEEEKAGKQARPGAKVAVANCFEGFNECEDDEGDNPPEDHEEAKVLCVLIVELRVEADARHGGDEGHSPDRNSVSHAATAVPVALADAGEEDDERANDEDAKALAHLGEAVDSLAHTRDLRHEHRERGEEAAPCRKVAVAGHDEGGREGGDGGNGGPPHEEEGSDAESLLAVQVALALEPEVAAGHDDGDHACCNREAKLILAEAKVAADRHGRDGEDDGGEEDDERVAAVVEDELVGARGARAALLRHRVARCRRGLRHAPVRKVLLRHS
eukprot:CAMPEP_0202070900 /NCGR_PEP_ID=MMETSP0964-20121228/1465_1 /ASSEMBLY_ACC=CAM_ASM_000500 /TAXON_ID=4773 /ORGANISM="Schizochytrium aggregatum, Strain ATCC28209" /LENGTH=299 /DNA_ID=CAMNT_0048637819 /DNA_START=354 /DNA_END=1250 /DNA_ORIENTATION=-